MFPKPSDLGLPAKFADWRPGQAQAVRDSIYCPTRFLIQNAPTGLGKTLMYIAAMLNQRQKTVILTSTKGLQDQLIRDFGEIGLVEVRGRKNYRCIRGDGPTCDDGLCHYGLECEFKGQGCPYYEALVVARQSRYVVTNYAMFLSMGEFLGEGVKTLVMDEAHAAPSHLDDHMAVEVELGFFGEVLGSEAAQMPEPDDELCWEAWLRETSERVQLLIKEGLFNPDMNLRKLRQLAKCARVLENLRRIIKSPLVIEQTGKEKYEINPLTLIRYAETHLFRGIPTVRMTSATVTEHTARMLGIGQEYRTLKEYPSPFPVASRPIYWIPTARVDRFMDHGARLLWLARIDQIVRSRMAEKGIIHTVSYDRAKDIVRANGYEPWAILHNSFDAAAKVQAFKRRKPPAFLVSPSMTTGWDFPYDECRWQIIAKVPFPDSRSLIQKKRQEQDPRLPFHLAWQTLIQSAGRGDRAEDDWCETLITDDHFEWLWHRHGDLAPSWFKAAIRRSPVLPERRT
jgi:ATP-dependent DNA helicase DinG